MSVSRATPPQPPRPVPRPRSHSAAREAAILTAAAELVVEVGFDRVTVDAIAARAHASKSTMYRKWPDKAQLIADALRRQAESSAPMLPDTGSVREDLLLTVRGVAGTLTADSGGPSLLTMVEAIRADAVLRDIVRLQIEERSRHDGALICARAISRGENLDAARGPVVVGLALAHLFLTALLTGKQPAKKELESLVDRTLLPLLTAPS